MDSFTEKGKAGEQFVEALVSKTFLSFWCYPNPHDETGDKKEICDLLILFKECCIICQVKNYEFKNNHERYFRKTVDAAIKQVAGAERKLFHLEKEIHIKHARWGLQKFEPEKYSKIIRLAVHLGEGLSYQNLGQIIPGKNNFVHIIGKEDFEYLLKELTTVADLVEYLAARENLVMQLEKVATLGGEKDLLALYLRIQPRFQEFINANKGERLLLDLENSWNEFEKERNDNDFAVLEVENLISNWVRDELFLFESNRFLCEELMSLNRHERRLFAVCLLNFIDTFSNKGYSRIIRRHIVLNSIGCIFFYYPNTLTGKELEAYMMVAAEGFSLTTDYEITKMIIVGLPSEGNISFTTCDLSQYKGYKQDELKQILDYLGWFQEENTVHYVIDMRRKKDVDNRG